MPEGDEARPTSASPPGHRRQTGGDQGSLLPNLVVAGVEKAGTTSLFDYLRQHPDICASDLKELNYFLPLRFPGGALSAREEYVGHYAHWRGEPYRLEASPAYWYGGPRVITALGEVLSEPRIVISLREPVARLWSAFTYLKSMGRLDRHVTIEDHVRNCESELGMTDVDGTPRHTPLSVGLYAEYLRPWLEAFDASRLRIVFAEDLFADPVAVTAGICRWLDIDPSPASVFRYDVRNETIEPKSVVLARAVDAVRRSFGARLARHPAVAGRGRDLYRALNGRARHERLDPATAERLRGFYRGSNALLAAELSERGYALPAWLHEPPG